MKVRRCSHSWSCLPRRNENTVCILTALKTLFSLRPPNSDVYGIRLGSTSSLGPNGEIMQTQVIGHNNSNTCAFDASVEFLDGRLRGISIPTWIHSGLKLGVRWWWTIQQALWRQGYWWILRLFLPFFSQTPLAKSLLCRLAIKVWWLWGWCHMCDPAWVRTFPSVF